jgi:hypothetical protein
MRNWPPALTEWSTKSVRDAFFASPHAIRHTVSRGVGEGLIAYVGKKPKGGYEPFLFKTTLDAADVEISNDIFILTAEEAEKHVSPPKLELLVTEPSQVHIKPGGKQAFSVTGVDQYQNSIDPGPIAWTATGGTIAADGVFEASSEEGNFLVTATACWEVRDGGRHYCQKGCAPAEVPQHPTRLIWSGEVAPQKWSQLYMKVLTKLVSGGDVRLKVDIEAILSTTAALSGFGCANGTDGHEPDGAAATMTSPAPGRDRWSLARPTGRAVGGSPARSTLPADRPLLRVHRPPVVPAPARMTTRNACANIAKVMWRYQAS